MKDNLMFIALQALVFVTLTCIAAIFVVWLAKQILPL